MTQTPPIKIDQLREPAFKYPTAADIVDPISGRVWLPGGQDLGLTIKEAATNAAKWWQNLARYTMPDYNKTVEHLEQAGMNSGILQGKVWAELNQGECLFVIWCWHSHVAFPQIQAGKDIGDLKVEGTA